MIGGGKSKQSSSKGREVNGYLKPGTFQLFKSYVEINEMGKSEALNTIVKRFFDSMPPDERRELINRSKNSY